MNNTNTGGFAFPHTPENVLTNCPLDGGMTLRDYFAAKAMQGILASLKENEEFHPELGPSYCYKVADAMLKAREQ